MISSERGGRSETCGDHHDGMQIGECHVPFVGPRSLAPGLGDGEAAPVKIPRRAGKIKHALT